MAAHNWLGLLALSYGSAQLRAPPRLDPNFTYVLMGTKVEKSYANKKSLRGTQSPTPTEHSASLTLLRTFPASIWLSCTFREPTAGNSRLEPMARRRWVYRVGEGKA